MGFPLAALPGGRGLHWPRWQARQSRTDHPGIHRDPRWKVRSPLRGRVLYGRTHRRGRREGRTPRQGIFVKTFLSTNARACRVTVDFECAFTNEKDISIFLLLPIKGYRTPTKTRASESFLCL